MSKQIYYRRKEKSIVIEGKEDGKSVLIWTLPDPEDLLSELLQKASFFSQEKGEKIVEKMKRLDSRPNKQEKVYTKVPTITITRTPEKDAVQTQISEEDRKKLWEMTRE